LATGSAGVGIWFRQEPSNNLPPCSMDNEIAILCIGFELWFVHRCEDPL
jgi:hypothetical protein